MLMLNQGAWDGKQIIPKSMVDALTEPSAVNPYYGLLWWLRYDKVWRVPSAAKLDALHFSAVDKLRPLVDRKLSSDEAFWLEAGARLSEAERTTLARLVQGSEPPLDSKPGRKICFYADGWLGQRLGVWPAERLVVVRQHRSAGGGDAENQSAGFRSLLTLSDNLVRRE